MNKRFDKPRFEWMHDAYKSGFDAATAGLNWFNHPDRFRLVPPLFENWKRGFADGRATLTAATPKQ